MDWITAGAADWQQRGSWRRPIRHRCVIGGYRFTLRASANHP